MNTTTLPVWVWLFPVTYFFHILEEAHAGEGFGYWIGHVIKRQIGFRQFYVANVILWLVMVTAIGFVPSGPPAVWLIAALGSIASMNGIGHLIGTIIIRIYSPGLVTGMVLWVPLGMKALWWARAHGSMGSWLFGFFGGLALMVCVGFLGLILSKPCNINKKMGLISGS